MSRTSTSRCDSAQKPNDRRREYEALRSRGPANSVATTNVQTQRDVTGSAAKLGSYGILLSAVDACSVKTSQRGSLA